MGIQETTGTLKLKNVTKLGLLLKAAYCAMLQPEYKVTLSSVGKYNAFCTILAITLYGISALNKKSLSDGD